MGLSKCCFETNFHEGTAKGEHVKIAGVDTYQVGKEHGNDKIIVILTDVFGLKYNNNLLVADKLSLAGYQVLIPDILFDDAIPGDVDMATFKWQDWFANHTGEKTSPFIRDFLANVRKELSPKFVGAVGHCFGAKYVVEHLKEDGLIDTGAAAHPSLLNIDDIKAISKPVIFSCAEVDKSFDSAFRKEAVDILQASGVRYQFDLFSGVQHGFAVRGDPKNPLDKYAKEKVLLDQAYWFDELSKDL